MKDDDAQARIPAHAGDFGNLFQGALIAPEVYSLSINHLILAAASCRSVHDLQGRDSV